MQKNWTSNQVKIAAAAFMLADHAGAVLIGPSLQAGRQNETMVTLYILLRLVGRLAFPLYCFLTAEGITHTEDIKKYTGRLFLFAVISEIPFNLARSGRLLYPVSQNVFFTLGLSVATFFCMKKARWSPVLILPLTCLLAILVKSDYGAIGPFTVFLMTVCRNPVIKHSAAFLVLANGAMTVIPGPDGFGVAIILFLAWYVIITKYNGLRGTPRLKAEFYWFYPVHLMILVGIRQII